tara:strand:- start:127 stop:543 length:417 start_codon:yes stop_codon:yes gene_type:complete
MKDNKNIIKISDYYKDYNLPDECFNSKSLKNLLELSALNNVTLIDKNKKKVNSKKKIINECKKLKKIKLKELTKELKDITTTETDVSSSQVRDTNNKYINGIENIDNIIKIINRNDSDINYLDRILTDNNEFIEEYSN